MKVVSRQWLRLSSLCTDYAVQSMTRINYNERFFSVNLKSERQRPKRQRVESRKYNEAQDVNKEDDIWSWIGNNSGKWSKEMLYFNLRFIGGTIFFLQAYSVYEYFRFGKIRWIDRVLWWIPNYLPQSWNDKLREISGNINKYDKDDTTS